MKSIIRLAGHALVAVALQVAALAAHTSVAAAQPASLDADAVARIHFDQGKSLAAAGKYREAYVEFEAGYRASPRPAFLFNMGEAARGMGDRVRARTAFVRYLAADPSGAQAPTARQRLAELGPGPVDEPTPAKPVESAKVTTPDKVVTPDRSPPPKLSSPRDDAAHDAAADERPLTVVIPPRRDEGGARPVWKKWPFWAAVGGVAVVGAVAGFVATRDVDVACGGNCIDLRAR